MTSVHVIYWTKAGRSRKEEHGARRTLTGLENGNGKGGNWNCIESVIERKTCLNSFIPDLPKNQQTNEATLEVLRFSRLLLLITIFLSDPFKQFGRFQDGGSKFFQGFEYKQSKTQSIIKKDDHCTYY
jgi:hypothetical protein